ncbi:DNA-directed DNA polymerase III PolC [Owenweeksia hongkongensis DSM 17368]|uniref:DNA polymerase III subunit alpha n=1 Tax=Owenweeksia hongkongensis (strain DSM 17368 / CIP 108786 / JCM 12287 / NRRL B-23963 / UST20020801) TaxID=926562 RepID=G8R526_OWEHD|nr:DNA polymerase III subunit alpha [Owenweeksia hongkongensis]AEV31037.1 DNA-directed DNA polymerase III PolC [Owenweeksia hongkongensis DSM 17368]
MFLNCHSYYSLRYGTMSVEELVSNGVATGATALALTDINATTGVFDFIKACNGASIKPIVGLEFWEESCKYIGLAKNREGFKELNEILTQRNLKKEPLPDRPMADNVFLIYPFGKEPKNLQENEFIGVRPDQVNKLLQYPNISRCVPLQPVTMAATSDFTFHQVLRSIDNNTLVSKVDKTTLAAPHDTFFPFQRLQQRFSVYPEVFKNAERIIEDCNFEFDFSTPKNKKYYTGSKHSDRQLLESLAKEGIVRRYGKGNLEAMKRVAKEIDVIDKLDFAGYFLITWDIIRYSQSRGFFHVGRGSGANSVVSYCLGITNICPIELNLYFERFLNSSRKTPPDFDIDWSWKDRDDILDYIFKRFDSRCTAFTGTVAKFKYRSTIREVGKALGLPKEELDILSKARATAIDLSDPIVSQVVDIGQRLEGFPNQRSVHSCGVIISEEPLTYYTALDLPPKGFPTVQFDMYIGEDIGFEKFDILSQRGIGHINECVEILKENRGVEIDIHAVDSFKDDPLLNEKLAKGETLGCFYIESPAMRGLLRRLKCDNYPVLVAASSIIRPGVAKSGMMREYIQRHNDPENFEYFHPVFEEQLADTYGIMVYQEDVIKIAEGFAKLDPTDGDILRRAMSGKTRSIKELDAIKGKFFANCKELGYDDNLAQEVYRQIESFAGYSFCKAHSASYAVESYQSLYLKTYYPIEFMVAVINNFGGFYRTEVYVHEAIRAGATVHAPCINTSDYNTKVVGNEIYLGFIHVEGLNEETIKTILLQRQQQDLFLSLDDFMSRANVGLEHLQTLVYTGAFRFTGCSKSELIIQVRMKFVATKPQPLQQLFQSPTRDFTLPELERTPIEDAFDEVEILGFPISIQPFDLLKTNFRGDVFVKDLLKYQGQVVRMLGYLISQKPVPTSRGLMYFGTWIDHQGEYFDTTHFPDNLQRYPFSGGGCYLLRGKVAVDFHFPTIEILQMAKLPYKPDPRYGEEGQSKERKSVNNDINPWIPQRAPYPSKDDRDRSFNNS